MSSGLSSESSPADARQESPRRRVGSDWQLTLALIVTLAIVLPRSLLVARAHSEYFDDFAHAFRGLKFLQRELGPTQLNDPPLGEGLIMLPAYLMDCRAEGHRLQDELPTLWKQPYSAETIRLVVAAWKSLLFVPFAGVVFCWCRSLYGASAGWVALALVIIDPTIASQIVTMTPDILGMEAIVVACYSAWRYFEGPNAGRLIGACVAVAAAVLMKHTAIILPGVVLGYAVLWWIIKPWRERQPWREWAASNRSRVGILATSVLLVALAMWLLLLADVSYPRHQLLLREDPTYPRDQLPDAPEGVIGRMTSIRWPAGTYVRSLIWGIRHGQIGHPGFLLGEERVGGWLWYFPVVATYKVPIGSALVVLLGALPLVKVAPRWSEWSLFLPLLAWLALMLATKINIGFRHFLPELAFLLMMGARCASVGRGWLIAAWAGIIVAAIHVASFHPDYLSYVNFPRSKPYLAISDSNLDWGQSLKQIRNWLDTHRDDPRMVYLRYFGKAPVSAYIDDPRFRLLEENDSPPTSGLLIVSPVFVAGLYDNHDRYTFLQSFDPIDKIGHTMLVYDLDRINAVRHTSSVTR